MNFLMNRAKPGDSGPSGPGGASNSTALEPRSGQPNPNTRTVSSRSGNRGLPGRKGRDYTRVSFYDRLKWLPPGEQILLLMYGEEGPGTPAQQVAAQIRTLKNLLARFPQMESSPTTFSIRDQIERRMAQLSSQERAKIKAGQMKGLKKGDVNRFLMERFFASAACRRNQNHHQDCSQKSHGARVAPNTGAA